MFKLEFDPEEIDCYLFSKVTKKVYKINTCRVQGLGTMIERYREETTMEFKFEHDAEERVRVTFYIDNDDRLNCAARLADEDDVIYDTADTVLAASILNTASKKSESFVSVVRVDTAIWHMPYAVWMLILTEVTNVDEDTRERIESVAQDIEDNYIPF